MLFFSALNLYDDYPVACCYGCGSNARISSFSFFFDVTLAFLRCIGNQQFDHLQIFEKYFNEDLISIYEKKFTFMLIQEAYFIVFYLFHLLLNEMINGKTMNFVHCSIKLARVKLKFTT